MSTLAANELETFKRNIDLSRYAASLGYTADRKRSWSGSKFMRYGADKIIVSRNRNGHHIYWSTDDPNDSGTIIDFAQRRKSLSLGGIRKELRPWL